MTPRWIIRGSTQQRLNIQNLQKDIVNILGKHHIHSIIALQYRIVPMENEIYISYEYKSPSIFYTEISNRNKGLVKTMLLLLIKQE
ncbi:hypothetical protein NQ315_006388 [Exocentrus adspersus]|uniref:Uncharacterized protein n=1 Tax=Exocentrus adspersus TaxID=1586481 RepID=A0AAV8W0M4_9CUCU|nr:hypothetical protein NQ315_006388 [Exocentrus adspersus]